MKGRGVAARGDAVFPGFDQFWICEPEQLPDPATWDQSNGLVVTANHGLVILTSEFMGDIKVTVDARDTRPLGADHPYGLAEGPIWHEIVEASIRCSAGPLEVIPVYDVDDLDLAGLPRIDTVGPGDYRLRVHARNRDLPALDNNGLESSTDEYLIVSWPQASRPPWLIRLTDTRGAETRYRLLPD